MVQINTKKETEVTKIDIVIVERYNSLILMLTNVMRRWKPTGRSDQYCVKKKKREL